MEAQQETKSTEPPQETTVEPAKSSSENIEPVEPDETIAALHCYQIKPSIFERFPADRVKEVIRNTHEEILSGQTYSPSQVKKWTMTIADEVNTRCKNLKMRHYKHIVQVILGERNGAGVKSTLRCLWDQETDGFTTDSFKNDTIFCVTAVFASYLY